MTDDPNESSSETTISPGELLLILAIPEAASKTPLAEPPASLLGTWERAGIRARLFPCDEKQSDEELIAGYEEEVARQCQARECGQGQIVLGGFSRGARIAAMLATRAPARALLCLSFPFHKFGDPQDRHGLQTLQELKLPILIVQGTRDAHGNRESVRGYDSLPPSAQIHWLEDGNHRWQVRQKTDASSDELLRSAGDASIEFFRGLEPRHEGA